MKVFLGGPFFTDSELEFMEKVKTKLRSLGHDVTTPLDIGYEKGGSPEVFKTDLKEISGCEALIAILDGLDPGTMCEIGYGKAQGKKVIGVWTDRERRMDPFIAWMCEAVLDLDGLNRLKEGP